MAGDKDAGNKRTVVTVAVLLLIIIGGMFFYYRGQAEAEDTATDETAGEEPEETEAPAVQITPVGDKRLLANRKFDFKVQASGEDVTITDDTDLFDIASDGSITFTPTPQQAGEHKVTITATDSKGNKDSVTVNFFIQKINNPPVVEQLGIVNLEAGVTRIIPVRAYDLDGDRLTYQLYPEEQARRFGMDINRQGEITWTPPHTQGVPMRVIVSDGTDVTTLDVYFRVY